MLVGGTVRKPTEWKGAGPSSGPLGREAAMHLLWSTVPCPLALPRIPRFELAIGRKGSVLEAEMRVAAGKVVHIRSL